jgi:hypothetical protein
MLNSAVVPSPDSPQPDAQEGRYTAVPRTSPPSARKTRRPALAEVAAATVAAGELGGDEGVGAPLTAVAAGEAVGDVVAAGEAEPDEGEGDVMEVEVDEVLVQPASAAIASGKTARRAGREAERNRGIMVTNLNRQ